MNLPETMITFVRRDELCKNSPALHDAQAEGNDFRGQEEVDDLEGNQKLRKMNISNSPPAHLSWQALQSLQERWASGTQMAWNQQNMLIADRPRWYRTWGVRSREDGIWDFRIPGLGDSVEKWVEVERYMRQQKSRPKIEEFGKKMKIGLVLG